jgi:hypothetical protein
MSSYQPTKRKLKVPPSKHHTDFDDDNNGNNYYEDVTPISDDFIIQYDSTNDAYGHPNYNYGLDGSLSTKNKRDARPRPGELEVSKARGAHGHDYHFNDHDPGLDHGRASDSCSYCGSELGSDLKRSSRGAGLSRQESVSGGSRSKPRNRNKIRAG